MESWSFHKRFQNTKIYLQTNHLHGSPDGWAQTISFPGPTNCVITWHDFEAFGGFWNISKDNLGLIRVSHSHSQPLASIWCVWLKSKCLGSQKSNEVQRGLLGSFDGIQSNVFFYGKLLLQGFGSTCDGLGGRLSPRNGPKTLWCKKTRKT